MTSLSHVKQKLSAAVHGLAAGQGPIKERLEAAFFVCAALRPEDFPEGELRHKWFEIQESLTAKETTERKGRIKVTLREIDEDRASEIAAMLVELALRVQELHRG